MGTFLLEIWEKRTISVTADDFTAAVNQIPSDCTFESVRKESDSYEDRLTEYDSCCLCCKPMLSDKNGPVDRWAKIVLDPVEEVFCSDCVHEVCADSQGRTVVERMR